MTMIDFHCHIDLYADPNAVASVCHDLDMRVLSVTTTPSAWSGTLRLARNRAGIMTALGLHPEIAHLRYNEINQFEEHIKGTKFVGEIGLDGSRRYEAYQRIQRSVFEHLLHACVLAGGKIISVHSRGAVGEAIQILKDYPDAGVPIMHWFTGTRSELLAAVALGCWFTVGPAMVRGKTGRALISAMPSDRVLPESDGPFCKVDGEILYPWHTADVVAELGRIWGLATVDAQEKTLANLGTLLTYA